MAIQNVRNFWVELDVDGKAGRVATGPMRKGGGFQLVIRQRDHGKSMVALRLDGFVGDDGQLHLIGSANDAKEGLSLHVTTAR
jgi:hypothetical protein